MSTHTRRAWFASLAAAYAAELPKDRLPRPADVDDVRIPGTLDGAPQPAWLLKTRDRSAAPLLVYLHSWSATYNHTGGIQQALAECRARNWTMISPDFRGPNERPQACASRFAVRDV